MPPRIVTARSIGLEFVTSRLAPLGPETSTVGHYSGGSRAKDLEDGIAHARSFHADHLSRGWAGIGYHFLIPDDGSIVCCRSTFHVGAHVENENSHRIGVNMPGTLTPTIRDRPTKRQARTFNWLIHNAHTDAMPRLHRTDNNLSEFDLFVHKELGSTDCPGLFTGMYHRGGLPWIEPTGNVPEPPDEGLAELTPEDEDLIVVIENDGLVHPHAPDLATGPDDAELGAPDGEAVLPEADPEFDEDLSELLEALGSPR